MKKLIVVLLFCFLIIPFKVNAALCHPIETSKSYYDIETSFMKFDRFYFPKKKEASLEEEEPRIVSGAEFNLTSIDEKYNFETNQSYEENRYFLNANKSVTAEELYNILPNSIKNIYDSINTKSDFNNLMEDSTYENYFSNCLFWIDSEGTKHSNSLVINVNIPIKIKETKTPDGYEKKDFVLVVKASIYFNYKTGEENIDNKQIVIENIVRKESMEYFYEYDSNLNYYENITSTNSIYDFLNDNSINLYGRLYNPLLPAKLEINNFIAGKSSYDTKSNTKVSYKIVASNKGGRSSNENIVKISIPKKLKVDVDTISDEGIYDENENAISWFIETLNGLSKKEFYFDIIVPEEVKGEYKLGSSISSNEDTVVASKTTLKVVDPIENPNTGDSNQLVLLSILIFLSSISYIFVNKKILINN